MGQGENLVSTITDYDDEAAAALHLAIEMYKTDQQFMHLIVNHFPYMTLRTLDKLLRETATFKVVNGALIVEDK